MNKYRLYFVIYHGLTFGMDFYLYSPEDAEAVGEEFAKDTSFRYSYYEEY